ncbi:DUF2752 domain-containing protein [Flavicella sediminum]|uniref:DUF2752 domain-containing protein n=1 Tax=Flavicella sediminum TaxID=2585141 RepID=UPI00111FB8F4
MLTYLRQRILLIGLAFCFISTLVAKACFSIDVLIPCLWKMLFHTNCWGCGISTAFIHLLHFNFQSAYQANPLVFIVLGISLFFFLRDINQFNKNNSHEQIT